MAITRGQIGKMVEVGGSIANNTNKKKKYDLKYFVDKMGLDHVLSKVFRASPENENQKKRLEEAEKDIIEFFH